MAPPDGRWIAKTRTPDGSTARHQLVVIPASGGEPECTAANRHPLAIKK